MRAVVMMGVPGAGKSHWIHSENASAQVATRLFVASADNYRMVEGVYTFDPKREGEVHAACLRRWIEVLQSCREDHGIRSWKDSVLVCDNTNAQLQFIAPYVETARALAVNFDLRLEVVAVLCDPFVAHARNQHGVPLQTVLRMDWQLRETLAKWPAGWPQPQIVHGATAVRAEFEFKLP
jgi:hypothetical protein